MSVPPARTIVYVDHSLKFGGASRVLLNLLKRIDRNKVFPFVVCGSGSELIQRVKTLEIPYATAQMPWFTRKAGLFGRLGYLFHMVIFGNLLRKVVNEHDGLIIHANNTIAALYCAVPARLLCKPMVWHMHDILEQDLFNKIFMRVAGWGASRILCVSEATKNGLVAFGVDERKCQVVYNYLEPVTLSDSARQQTLREEFAVPAGMRIVGMVGNLCWLKGQMVLLRAVNAILGRCPDTVFVIVGGINNEVDFPYKNDLEEFIIREGFSRKVYMLGFRHDAARLIAEMDILVHPPIQPDSQPLVLLEAMAAGKPVVASMIGGIPEMVTSGVNGFLIPPDDDKALADSVCRLLENPDLMYTMGREGQRAAMQKYSVDVFLDSLSAAYDEVLNERAPTDKEVDAL